MKCSIDRVIYRCILWFHLISRALNFVVLLLQTISRCLISCFLYFCYENASWITGSWHLFRGSAQPTKSTKFNAPRILMKPQYLQISLILRIQTFTSQIIYPLHVKQDNNLKVQIRQSPDSSDISIIGQNVMKTIKFHSSFMIPLCVFGLGWLAKPRPKFSNHSFKPLPRFSGKTRS